MGSTSNQFENGLIVNSRYLFEKGARETEPNPYRSNIRTEGLQQWLCCPSAIR